MSSGCGCVSARRVPRTHQRMSLAGATRGSDSEGYPLRSAVRWDTNVGIDAQFIRYGYEQDGVVSGQQRCEVTVTGRAGHMRDGREVMERAEAVVVAVPLVMPGAIRQPLIAVARQINRREVVDRRHLETGVAVRVDANECARRQHRREGEADRKEEPHELHSTRTEHGAGP